MPASSGVYTRLEELIAESGGAKGPGSFLIGLAGRGIQLSRTPTMHELEGARLGMPYRYTLIDFDRLGFADEDLAAVIEVAQELRFAGLNVTHPFKQSVIPFLNDLSPQAAAIGAVNTVVFAKGTSSGHNTDNWGFAQSFRLGMQGCRLNRVLQLGAGGAGAAVAHALLELGAGELLVFDTDQARSSALCQDVAKHWNGRVNSLDSLDGLAGKVDGLVNTTPVGMAKYPGMPVPLDMLEARPWVAEIIYFPQETELLRQARALGCHTLSGIGMAVYQAVRAFELFTGVAPDPEAMTRHFGAAA
ncbi:shikimate dehydrogenase [Corticibacterium sp. UT-5YL-CI-8]|nr:shikimate dehydrogenase [Tianweitania sp. UT-5YL-CI-8]